MSKQNSIGNRTRDLPARSAVPQPTAPPRSCTSVRQRIVDIKGVNKQLQVVFLCAKRTNIPVLWLAFLLWFRQSSNVDHLPETRNATIFLGFPQLPPGILLKNWPRLSLHILHNSLSNTIQTFDAVYTLLKSLFYWLTDDGYNTQPKHVEAKKIVLCSGCK